MQVVLAFAPAWRVRPGELPALVEAVEERLEQLVRTGFTDLPVRLLAADTLFPDPREVPVFPVDWGGRRIADPTGVVDALEALRSGTRFGGLLHDRAGRAFSCHIDVRFRREPARDAPPGER